MDNNVYIEFSVTSFEIFYTSGKAIPSGNQNYVFAKFNFSNNWDKLNKIAIISKKDIETVNVPIVDSVFQVPNEFLKDVGIIEISVFAGDRRTVNTATVEIIKSGFIEGIPVLPPEPNSLYVQSPDSTVPYIRYYNGNFEFFANGIWNIVKGIGGEETIPINLISDDNNNALILGLDDKLFVPFGAKPYVLYLINGGVLTRTKPTTNQIVINRTWRPTIWGEWSNIATLEIEEELARTEVELIMGNIFTAKLWLTSDIAIPNTQLRLTITDKTDNTDLAIATTTVDLNNINTILTPATFINKFLVSKAISLSQVQITLSVMVLAPATQFGVISNVPAQLSFSTIIASSETGISSDVLQRITNLEKSISNLEKYIE